MVANIHKPRNGHGFTPVDNLEQRKRLYKNGEVVESHFDSDFDSHNDLPHDIPLPERVPDEAPAGVKERNPRGKTPRSKL